jgi:hypothetical protein
MKANFENHGWCLTQLDSAQQAEKDMREQARECQLFVNKKDGQWEPFWWNINQGRPRYTYDQVSPVIAQIVGQIRKTDFDTSVRPQGGESSKQVADKYDGIVRNIESTSKVKHKYRRAGRKVAIGGLDYFEVVQAYVDGDSFDQDLQIKRVADSLNSVWLGPHVEQDGSDAQYGWKIVGMDPEAYKEKYPDRAVETSTFSDKPGPAYWHRRDQAWVGEFRYLLSEDRGLVLMDNGKVYEANADYESIKDELAAQGIKEVRRRTRSIKVMHSRKFDSAGWIDEKPKRTEFRHRLNLIPVYAHFDVDDDGKLVYYGAVLKMMDPQRNLNYTKSREVEEASLSPRRKIAATKKMAEGETDQWSKLNTSSDPVLFYTPDERVPEGPREIGGAQINPALATLSADMKDLIRESSGMHHANMADNPNAQSGIAIENLLDQGDTGNTEYLAALEVAIGAIGDILVDTIPRVYKPGRQIRILDADGSYDIQPIGEPIRDEQTGQWKYQWDLSAGQYDTYTVAGQSYRSRQNATLGAFEKLASYLPGLLESNADIVLRHAPGPGMEQAAERERWKLLMAGVIPEEQQTDEEKEKLALMQQQQQGQPDPNMALAMAEQTKAEADVMAAQNDQFKMQADYALEADKLELKRMELAIKAQEVGAKVEGIEARALRDVVEAQVKAVDSRVRQGQAILGAVQ